MTLLYPWLAGLATLFVVIVVVLRIRGTSFTFIHGLILAGLVGLILSLASPVVDWKHAGKVAVMVDLSPSTRGAAYRDRASLLARVGPLVGSNDVAFYAFASDAVALPDDSNYKDIPVERTTFAVPPDADAVVLFSDGQFERPTSGVPTYAVVDPALSRTSDASVRRLDVRDGAKQLAATFCNTGPSRAATFTHVKPLVGATITTGELVVTRDLLPAPGEVSVRLSAGDAWPENDSLDLILAPPSASERWWITNSAGLVPPGFRAIAPDKLDTDPAAWLVPSVVALDDLWPPELPVPVSRAISTYVADLGGSLLLTGSGRTLGPGGLSGSPLDALCPLSFTSPAPKTEWVLLVDASGSMAEQAGSMSRWERATRATADLLRTLPPADGIAIGSFSQNVRWWTTGKSVKQTLEGATDLPPRDVRPGGPTNLDAAFTQLATDTDGATPTQLLVVTDARATFADVNGLVSKFTSRGVRVSALLVDDSNDTTSALADLCTRTGGTVERAGKATDWSRQLQSLSRGANPTEVERTPLQIRWTTAAGAALPSREVDAWRRSWIKDRATTLVEGTQTTADAGVQFPGASWQVGAGKVVALAFTPTRAEVVALAGVFGTAARDPRLRVTWDAGPVLRVTVRASDAGGFLNGLALSLDLRDAGDPSVVSTTVDVPQTAPGVYEVELHAPRRPTIGTLRVNNETVVDRVSLAGRYAPEFDAIGNDLSALTSLVTRTGGRVIAANDTRPIDFNWPRVRTSLAPVLAIVSVALLLAAVVAWRVRYG